MSKDLKKDEIFKDEVVLDHDYDGIQELDNPLPRWWVYLFALCVLFGIWYMAHLTLGPGKSIEEQFTNNMQTSQSKRDANSNKAQSIVVNDATVAAGKAHYVAKCAACHGMNGEGGIGPNLTDVYWIHGKGNLKDIYVVIDQGVPDKGMLAWGTMMSPKEMADVTAYVKSLEGSNPANAKEAQGQKAR